jgi:hypothetical protein
MRRWKHAQVDHNMEDHQEENLAVDCFRVAYCKTPEEVNIAGGAEESRRLLLQNESKRKRNGSVDDAEPKYASRRRTSKGSEDNDDDVVGNLEAGRIEEMESELMRTLGIVPVLAVEPIGDISVVEQMNDSVLATLGLETQAEDRNVRSETQRGEAVAARNSTYNVHSETQRGEAASRNSTYSSVRNGRSIRSSTRTRRSTRISSDPPTTPEAPPAPNPANRKKHRKR